MIQNTTCKYPTQFLRGVELIQNARKKYNMRSENWTYPTRHRLGNPNTDKYYAEIWSDGMDYNTIYWCIETVGYGDPQVRPLLFFPEIEKMPRTYVLEEIIMDLLQHRRNELWLKEKDSNIYYDRTWSFYKWPNTEDRIEETPCLIRCKFEHASQKEVEFYVNKEMFPAKKMKVYQNSIIVKENCTINTEYPKQYDSNKI